MEESSMKLYLIKTDKETFHVIAKEEWQARDKVHEWNRDNGVNTPIHIINIKLLAAVNEARSESILIL
jgi:hypothetical protein